MEYRGSAAEFFSGLGMFSMRLGLNTVREMLERAGHPEHGMSFVHIAGTNGKGSTGAMIEAGLRSAGIRTGFYSSPHLIDIRERFRIDGKMVSESIFESTTRRLAELESGIEYTYFEFATVLAAMLFHNAGCETVVWETGLGGRLDATNAVDCDVAVITGIALDHTAILGPDLASIAREKAGIIKPEADVFTGPLASEAETEILAKARAVGAHMHSVGRFAPNVELSFAPFMQRFDWNGVEVELALPGKMQTQNFALAATILQHLARCNGFDFNRALTGMRSVRWPGRMQFVTPRLIVDGGHNPDGVAALTSSLGAMLPGEKFNVIYGGFEDKAVDECLRIWAPLAATFRFVGFGDGSRPSRQPESLCESLSSIAPWIPAIPSDIGTALRESAGLQERTVVSGSLFLAGLALEMLSGRGAAGDLV
ncbi:MAG: hypothetical protein MJ025_01105 [Victivallaceae bacterium]|nr:hypothetical protein [Victivallaceae bacterium]